MTCVHYSVENALLLQPDWLTKRAAEAAIWANTVLSKASVVQVLRQKLLRGEPSTQLRSTALNPAAFGAESFRGETSNIPTRGAVEAVVQRRAELLPSGAIEGREGKVLLFTPQD